MPSQVNTWATGTPGQGILESSQSPLMGQPQYVWDPNVLSWVKMIQPGGGTGGAVTQGTVPWVTDQQQLQNPATSGAIATPGDNTIYTPTSGKTARVKYVSVGADIGNASQVVTRLKASSTGYWYTWPLAPSAVVARNVGAGKFYLAGGVNDSIILNLSASGTVYWSLEVDEI